MARPPKQGVDYFPFDVYLDNKFKFIEIKYKLEGFAVLVKLLQKVYSCGYWCRWTDDEALLFSDEIRADLSLVTNVVQECLDRDIFHKPLYEQFGVLTSKGIQKRYKEIVRRRTNVEVTEEYLLIDGNFGVNDGNNSINDGSAPESRQHTDGKSTQSKVKESKVNNTKVKDTKTKDHELSLEIENFRQRYSSQQLILIDEYFDMLRHTRVSAKVTLSVILKIYKAWDKHPPICVEYGVKIHTEKPEHHSKRENYTLGIISKTMADEAAKKLTEPPKKLFEQGEASKQRQAQPFKPLTEDNNDISDDDLL